MLKGRWVSDIERCSNYVFNFKEINDYLNRISIDYNLSNTSIRMQDPTTITYKKCFYLPGNFLLQMSFISYAVRKLQKGSKLVGNIYNYTKEGKYE